MKIVSNAARTASKRKNKPIARYRRAMSCPAKDLKPFDTRDQKHKNKPIVERRKKSETMGSLDPRALDGAGSAGRQILLVPTEMARDADQAVAAKVSVTRLKIEADMPSSDHEAEVGAEFLGQMGFGSAAPY